MYLDQSTFKNKRAVCYYRKSTDDAYRQKYSIDSQKEQMRFFCKQMGIIIDHEFKDDHSAKDFKRPGWTELMNYLRSVYESISYVLIIDYSRFSRNDVQAYVSISQLDEWEIELQAIDQLLNYEVPESLFMRANYISLPAVDNKWRAIKVKRGMTQSLKNGNWCGGRLPRGYWKDKNTGIVSVNKEGDLIGQAFHKIAHSEYTIKEAQVFLNVRGVNITFKALSKVLRNTFYKGIISHKLLGSETAPGKHTAVVDSHTWHLVQEVLSGNKKQGKQENLFPLKQFLSCPNCGNLYTAYVVKRKQKSDGSYRIKKSQPVYYRCSCTSSISGLKLHESFYELLSSLCIDPNDVALFKKEAEYVFSNMQKDALESRTLIKKQLSEKTSFLNRIEEKFINGEIDSITYKKHKEITQLNISQMNNQLKKQLEISNPSKFVSHCMKFTTKLAYTWKEAILQDQRRLQNLVFPEGLQYDNKKQEYRTPRINSIFVLINSLSVGNNKKTSPSTLEKLVYSPLAVRTDHKSNPIYIEDFIKLEKEEDLFNYS